MVGHIPLGFSGFNKPPIKVTNTSKDPQEPLQFTLKPTQFPL